MKESFGLDFHHHGLALGNDREALIFLEGLGYICGPQMLDPEQNVNLRLCQKAGSPSVEIITPGIGDGPLTPILRRYDQLIYHTCYESADASRSVERMERAGLRLIEISGPKPAVLFGGRQVSFFTLAGFGIIELLEK